MIKQISPSTDSQGVTLFAPTSTSSNLAFPVIATSSGALLVSSGLDVPVYDTLALSGSPLSSVQFYVGGTGGTLVATLTLTYNSGALATVARS